MPHPAAAIDYQKCQSGKCESGVCAAAVKCPNKVLRQEAPYEFPFFSSILLLPRLQNAPESALETNPGGVTENLDGRAGT